MFNKRIKSKSWYPYTIALCTAVLLFVLLTHFADIRAGVSTFFGYFMPVIWGCAIAYLINPLANFYNRTIFRGIASERIRNIISNTLAFITVLMFLIFVMVLLIPQLISSIMMFVNNIDKYIVSLEHFLDYIGLSSESLGLQHWIESPDALLHKLSAYIRTNMDDILATSADAGIKIIQLLISILLSIYLLFNKNMLKSGLRRFLKAALDESRYETTRTFLLRCNSILNRYIVFNILDALLVGVINATFMFIMGFPYAGLISVVVGVTNLVPTFGPFVGGAIGAFILLLIKPWYAAAFMLFTLVLQLIDGYIIKPKLFGESLGVPALWILVGIVVGGKMFGIIGILLSIPIVAILDFSYKDYFLPWLESNRKKSASE
ncbi:MAG: AI-2E family transporter [Anaerovoracaceae bacterium]|nr:AI-2E family transporter [Anaerovoracaceae bacterium]